MDSPEVDDAGASKVAAMRSVAASVTTLGVEAELLPSSAPSSTTALRVSVLAVRS
jgi:hypothetical protein